MKVCQHLTVSQRSDQIGWHDVQLARSGWYMEMQTGESSLMNDGIDHAIDDAAMSKR